VAQEDIWSLYVYGSPINVPQNRQRNIGDSEPEL
jgi:hypothetical protein